jgi:large subunit ribosomal protein L24
MKSVTGGVIDKTLSIHQSNVAIFNVATGNADRVGIKLLSDAEQKSRKTQERGVRVFRSSGDEIKV